MNKKRVHFVILCEDKQHHVFVRRMLQQLNFNFSKRDLRISIPSGGSGEQHVRENYHIEAQEHRRRAANCMGGLVVVTDADNETVKKHQDDFAQQLENASLSPRNETEGIVILIPKWNIETWIHFLFGNEVREDEKGYPKLRGRESDCQPAVEQLISYLRTSLPENCPPSLQLGAEELKTRLPS